ncbi:hypothetical protein HDU87_006854 [Geranomyces variabilis]|uniref:Uncharacterized protein n=1 Tax=Geranomyces variabilis TaxID=109894 RepID=A0AAD5TPZ0_9FUNG|nr:hypothetical protein HDU87_006854 [Geranomyces variabilis]
MLPGQGQPANPQQQQQQQQWQQQQQQFLQRQQQQQAQQQQQQQQLQASNAQYPQPIQQPRSQQQSGFAPAQQQYAQQGLSPDQFRELVTAAKLRQEQGATEHNDPEFARMIAVLRQHSHLNRAAGAAQRQIPAPAFAPPAPPIANANASVVQPALSSATQPGVVAPPAQGASVPAPAGPFTQEQLTALRCQIYVFKLISGNKPVPEHLRQRVFNVEHLRPEESEAEIHPIPQKIVELAQKQALAQPPGARTSPLARSVATRFEMGPHSSPNSLLPKKVSLHELSQRVVIPSGTPTGIDPYALIQERERHIKARIAYRISELENQPSSLSNENGSKMRALIELKGLKLLEKQTKLRTEVIQSLGKATTLSTAADRSSFRRVKKQSLREARQTEKLEKNQRLEREKRDKQKHHDYVQWILQHGRDMVHFHKQQQSKNVRLGQAVGRFHVNAQKEEEKRQSRVSQERLNALKANDEAAYLKLVDKAKDTRITHLLNQTTAYLHSLTKAMSNQKASVMDQDLPIDPSPADAAAAEGEEAGEPDYYGSAHKIQEEVTEQSSLLVGGKLKDYQVKGLQWMVSLYNNRLNGILADEMGLGKTIQTISLITYLMEKKKQNGPYLVIVPLSTITNWDLEFDRWAPSVKKIVFKGSPPERMRMRPHIKSGNFNVVITTYEYVINEKALLSKMKWVYMIIDEGHRMKNNKSKLSITLMQHYNTRYRVILTGTPLQNNLPELWALLNFILPMIFNSVETFDEWFNHPFAKEGGKDNEVNSRLNEEESLLIIRGLHKVLRPFLLRRLKKDVESELPDKVETVIKCSMSALQYRLYEQIRNKKSSFSSDGQKRSKALNNLVMQFRKVCNHPYVFAEVEESLNPHGITDDNLWRVAGKFELLDRVLPKYKAAGHRILMFFQMTQVMDIMEDYLRFKSHHFLRLDGHTKAEDRTVMLKMFNGKEDPPFIFLLSTRAGGLGLNLQTADTVIIFDSDWNPHQDLQAQDRAHRIGQTKEVRILRLITARSVEETILARAQYKLDMDGKVIQAGKFDNKTTDRERDELLRSLFGGEEDEEEKDAENEGNLDDQELNEIIARDDAELQLFHKMDIERNKQELMQWRALGNRDSPPPRLMTDSELPAIYLKEEDDAVPEEVDLGRGARVRKDVIYDDGMNDDQFVAAVEDGDLEGAIERRVQRKLAKQERERKRRDAVSDDDDEDDVPDVPASRAGKTLPQAAQGLKTPGPRRRGRPPGKKARVVEADDTPGGDADDAVTSTSRRARKIKFTQDIGDETPVKRSRKKKFAGVDVDEVDVLRPAKRRAFRRIFEAAYKVVEEAEVEYDNGTRRKRCDLFIALPPKAHYPDYYEIIKSPIAMDMILHRLRHVYYKSIDQFVADFHLMFANAMHYNLEGSEVYDDALQMKKAFDAKVEELAPGGQAIVTAEDEAEPESDAPSSGRNRKRSLGGHDDATDDDDFDMGGGKGRKRAADDDDDDEEPEALKKPRKKTKRDSGVPGEPSKYVALPRIRMRLPVPDGEDGEIFDE